MAVYGIISPTPHLVKMSSEIWFFQMIKGRLLHKKLEADS
jgi:hypothetical protein